MVSTIYRQSVNSFWKATAGTATLSVYQRDLRHGFLTFSFAAAAARGKEQGGAGPP
jgi:hypothetical protein